MEFDKSKVYTLLNADEVKIGSEGYFADNLEDLKDMVESERGEYCGKIDSIEAEGYSYRFRKKDKYCYGLFYLVEEPKEKKFRPYKDTDEMIEDFKRRYSSYGGWSGKDNPMYNPMIWVKAKGAEKNKYLITRFHENTNVTMNFGRDVYTASLPVLLDDYTYLDGTPCGIGESE